MLLRKLHFQRDFGMIQGASLLLKLSVYPAAPLHRICLHSARAAVVNIPAAQNKFHKVSYGYFYFHSN